MVVFAPVEQDDAVEQVGLARHKVPEHGDVEEVRVLRLLPRDEDDRAPPERPRRELDDIAPQVSNTGELIHDLLQLVLLEPVVFFFAGHREQALRHLGEQGAKGGGIQTCATR